MLLSWRRFNFFDRDPVTDPDTPAQPFLGLQDIQHVDSCVQGEEVAIADKQGGICTLNKHMQMNYWKAYKYCLYKIDCAVSKGVLVTAGEDDEGIHPLIKLWDLKKQQKGIPFCLKIHASSPNNRPARVTSLCIHQSLQVLAVGFEDSSLILYRGDLTKDKWKSDLLRDGVTCGGEGAVVGLAFQNLPQARVNLFVACTHAVFSYLLREGKEEDRKTVHDRKQCQAMCCAKSDSTLQHQFIVARREMVYLYTGGGVGEEASPGRCYGLEGEKILIALYREYLLIVTKHVPTLDAAQTETMNMVTIYNLLDQYIAYSAPMPEVSCVFVHWETFHVLCKNGRLFRLQEKDIHSQLEILFRKNLFDLAINLAKRHLCDKQNLGEIFKHHGDYLYEKGDYDNAVNEYIQTIGVLQPSYVIRKFLDAQHMVQLTKYLEALHLQTKASQDHTSILLNCYTKLGHTKKIDKFVNGSELDHNFDLHTAIKVLRNSNYLEQAMVLARRQGEHEQYLKMLIDDNHQYANAVKYVAQLRFEQAEEMMKKYGQQLMQHVPDATSTLLNKLCFGEDTTEENRAVLRASPDEFMHIFVNDPSKLREFLEHTLKHPLTSRQPALYNTLLELNLKEYALQTDYEQKSRVCDEIVALLSNEESLYELDHALVLCQTYNCGPGLVQVFHKAKLYMHILHYYMSVKNYDKVLETCKKYEQSDMWIEALWFVARHDDSPMDCVSQLLENIREQAILPPLMVLEILSHSHTVTLGIVKDYLMSWLKKEKAYITEGQAKIEEYRQEIEANNKLVDDLKNKPQVFQVSKCTVCDTTLEVPTVHFLCKHSYHAHCFESYSEGDQCPACLPNNRHIKQMLDAQERGRDTYHEFRTEVANSEDSLKTVSEFFGRGIFHKKLESFMSTPTEPANPFEME